VSELTDLRQRVFEAIESGDWATVEEAISPQAEFKAPGIEASGAAAATGFMKPFMAAFPDIEHRFLSTVEADGTLAFEMQITGTHTAPLAGPEGEVPPTQARIDFPASNHWKVENGKIVSYHSYFDQMTFMAQIGLLPAPG
jgi:predicted ester cyclase